MRRNIGLSSPDTEIVFRFSEWGMGPIDMAFYRYIDHRLPDGILCRAEREGGGV